MGEWRFAHLTGLTAALCFVFTDVSVAQYWTYGQHYGSPYGRRRVVKPHSRQPSREAVPPQEAEVPLPPPRPRFPGEGAQPGEAPAKEVAPAASPPPEPPKAEKPGEVPVAKPDAAPATAKPTVPEKAAPPTPPAPVPGQPTVTPLPPEKPPELKQTPGTPAPKEKPGEPQKPPKPAVAPSGARLGETPGQPVDDTTCPARLKARNVAVEPLSIGPQPDERCTVVQAVRLTGLSLPDGSKVDFPEHPTIACTTADSFSLFVRDLLSPLAKGTFGAPVASIWTGPGLECRSRDHVFGAKLSAHGQGLAIDIAQLKLADGRMIEVGQAKDDRGQNFETAARNAACGYFHTVLGPGSDSYHRTHWHFDLEVRGSHGDSKYCK